MSRCAFILSTAVILGVVPSAWAEDYKGPPTPCDTVLSVGDAAGILSKPDTVNHYSMGASEPGQGCELGTAGDGNAMAMIDISVKTSGGKQYLQTMMTLSPGKKPIPGLGDEAYDLGDVDSNIPDATETDVYVRKGDATCEAQLHGNKGAAGDALVVPRTDEEIGAKLGALCLKALAGK